MRNQRIKINLKFLAQNSKQEIRVKTNAKSLNSTEFHSEFDIILNI